VALVIDDALDFEAAQREKNHLELLLDLKNSLVANLELRDLLRAMQVLLPSPVISRVQA
jgi:hypothetical protein